MQNNDYVTKVKWLRPADKESFEILDHWASRKMAAGEKIDSEYLVENYEKHPDAVKEYLKQVRART